MYLGILCAKNITKPVNYAVHLKILGWKDLGFCKLESQENKNHRRKNFKINKLERNNTINYLA